MNFKDLKQLCLSHGFTNVAPLACDTIELKPEVRQMCASDSCHKYNKCWSCPPDCGTLEECEQRVRKYKLGILVQTVGQLEDSMDGEGMMRTEAMHKASFYSLEKDLRKFYPNMLPIGAGCCTKCKTCTCPDAPCRLSGPGLFLYGSLWNAGHAGLSGKPPGLLLWSWKDCVYQLLFIKVKLGR